MEAIISHGVKNTILILFYSQEPPFPFALTYDMVLHNVPKCVNPCENSTNIIPVLSPATVYNFALIYDTAPPV